MKAFTVLKKSILSIFVATFLLFSGGCVYLIVGGIGAVGGYIVSPDTVEGLTENDEITVWDTTIEIISIMGLIIEQNEDAGIIAAKISGAKVNITIAALNDSSVKLTVKARKAYLPKISLAQDIFVKIMSSLEL